MSGLNDFGGREVFSERAAASRRILNRLLYGLEGFAGAFLHAPVQFLVLAGDEFQVIVSQVSPFFAQLALDHVPITFDFEAVHGPIYHIGGFTAIGRNPTTLELASAIFTGNRDRSTPGSRAMRKKLPRHCEQLGFGQMMLVHRHGAGDPAGQIRMMNF